MKYRVQITTLEQVQPDNSAAQPYEKQTTIYDQTLDSLDVSKVVIAANECIAKTCAAPTTAAFRADVVIDRAPLP